MDYKLLSDNANVVIKQLDFIINKYGSTQPLESIKQQMIFIRDNALQSKNPINELGKNRYFTYGVLASKELASPEELEIQKNIYRVSNILYPET